MYQVIVIAVNQSRMSDDLARPDGDLLGADGDDGAGHDFPGDGIAGAQKDFVPFAQFRGVLAIKCLLPAIFYLYRLTLWLKPANGRSLLDPLGNGRFPEQRLLLFACSPFNLQ